VREGFWGLLGLLGEGGMFGREKVWDDDIECLRDCDGCLAMKDFV